MPFSVFNFGSVLVVAGFTLKVLEVTNRLTEVKKGSGTKLQFVGFLSIVVGLFFGLTMRGMPEDMRSAMNVAGLNIAAVGTSTLIGYYLKPKHAKILSWGSIGVTILGFLLCYLYVLS
jgi:hypothetical protein